MWYLYCSLDSNGIQRSLFFINSTNRLFFYLFRGFVLWTFLQRGIFKNEYYYLVKLILISFIQFKWICTIYLSNSSTTLSGSGVWHKYNNSSFKVFTQHICKIDKDFMVKVEINAEVLVHKLNVVSITFLKHIQIGTYCSNAK